MTLALIQTKTTVVRIYETCLPSQLKPYRKPTKIEIRITTINGEYVCHTTDDSNNQATAIELLEIGAEVLRILKEDEESAKVTKTIVSATQQPPTTTDEDCPF